MCSSLASRLLCCAVVLLAAGCGGIPIGSPRATDDAQAQRWVQCMQQHGVAAGTSQNGQGGSGIHVPVPGTGPDAESKQQLQAAQAACKRYEPNGGQARRSPSAQELDRTARYVQCLNQHGADAQMTNDGGITERPGPGGPSAEAQADEACRSLAPGGH
ncbi:MAG: hypothetical protein E6J41_10920 [Chloroflexi bacterium]|nr:MAG: hypothetical protein E6J41_10920 [Chloroflexota bacterium]